MRSWGVWGFHFFSSTISFFHSHTKTNVCGKVASINLSLSENTWLIWQLTWSYPGFWPTFSYSYILVLHWSKFQSHVHPSSLENREFTRYDDGDGDGHENVAWKVNLRAYNLYPDYANLFTHIQVWKEKETLAVVCLRPPVKREIRHFPVVVVKWRKRNVQ